MYISNDGLIGLPVELIQPVDTPDGVFTVGHQFIIDDYTRIDGKTYFQLVDDQEHKLNFAQSFHFKLR